MGTAVTRPQSPFGTFPSWFSTGGTRAHLVNNSADDYGN